MRRALAFGRRTVPAVAGLALALAVADARAAEVTAWTFGSLSLPRANDSAVAGGLGYQKQRLSSLSLPGFGGAATLRSWVASAPAGAGAGPGASGFLIDIPVGGLQFTPSIGAALGGRSGFGSASSLEIRSQLELGYEFDNHARFSLGVSRSSDRNRAGGEPDDVFAFYYRLPLGW